MGYAENSEDEVKELKRLLAERDAQLAAVNVVNEDNKKIVASIKEDILASVLTSIILKSVVSGLIVYLVTRGTDLQLTSALFGFLALYLIFSVFGFLVKITGNYILAFIAFILLIFGASHSGNWFQANSLIDKVLYFTLLPGPVVWDIFRLIRIFKR